MADQFLAQFFDENEPWLLVGISNSSDQHMKKLMAQREGLRVTLIMERTHDENIHDRIKHFFLSEELCVDGTFRKCTPNPIRL